MAITGFYLDGASSKQHPASLRYSGVGKVTISYTNNPDEPSVSVGSEQIRVESRLGNTPRELDLGDGRMFITEDHDGIDQLQKALFPGSRHGLLHKLESNMRLIAVSVVVCVLSVYGLVGFGFPAAAKYIAFNSPEFVTQQFGGSIDILDKTLFEPSKLSADKKQEVRAWIDPFLAEESDSDITLAFRSGMGANALALPDGTVVFTDDFIKLADQKEEVLAVFFHELGHVRQKHTLRRTLQAFMMTLGVLFITGDLESADLVGGLPIVLMELNYSRAFENEADAYAFEKMKAHNVDLEHFVSIMNKLHQYCPPEARTSEEACSEKVNEQTSFLSTHPGLEERIKNAEQAELTPVVN